MAEDNVDYNAMSTEELLRLEKHYASESARYSTAQLAKKVLLNSLYGALGQKDFRYFDVALASSVTLSGQLAIKWIERKVNEFIDRLTGIPKDRVVLIDTDSIVIDLEDLVTQKCPNLERSKQLDFLNIFGEKAMNPFIEKSYQEMAEYVNAYEQKMHMKRENIFNVLVSCARKMYAGSVYNSEGVQYSIEDPKWKIMGLALVKSSTPKPIRGSLKETLEIILRNGTEADVQKKFQEVKELYHSLSVEDIAFPRGVTSISQYDFGIVSRQAKRETDPKKRAELLAKLKDNDGTTSTRCYVKGTPIQARASLLYNELIDKYGLSQRYQKIEDSGRVNFVYLKMPNPIRENVIGFVDKLPPEFGLHEYVDWDKMFDSSYVSAMEAITDKLGWKLEKEESLDDFFF